MTGLLNFFPVFIRSDLLLLSIHTQALVVTLGFVVDWWGRGRRGRGGGPGVVLGLFGWFVWGRGSGGSTATLIQLVGENVLKIMHGLFTGRVFFHSAREKGRM